MLFFPFRELTPLALFLGPLIPDPQEEPSVPLLLRANAKRYGLLDQFGDKK